MKLADKRLAAACTAARRGVAPALLLLQSALASYIFPSIIDTQIVHLHATYSRRTLFLYVNDTWLYKLPLNAH